MSELAIALSGVTVRYGALEAVRRATFEVARGEVHALVGENGAGKSTLMRAIYGLAPLAEGELSLKGERVAHPSPARAIARGVGMVHQHFLQVETLSVADNVVLGREPKRRGLYDRARAERDVAEQARAHGLSVEPRRRVGELSVGERQRVEIVKALSRGADVLILDEPTAVLTPSEAEELFRVLRALKAGGATVVLVTHKLDEVMAIADRVTVLRRGEVQAVLAARDTTPQALAHAMVGREVRLGVPGATERPAPGEVVLEVERASVAGDQGARSLHGVSLSVRAGEILGVAGVEGNGQTELAEAIAGLRRLDSGRILLGGAAIERVSAAARRQRGLGFVPEDRHRFGLLLDRSIADNLYLGREEVYARPRWGGPKLWIDRAALLGDARRLLERFDVRPADPEAPARALSGGNQQKIVLARELERRPRALVAAQPTRGVDVGAIERIHGELDALRRAGCAILLVSAELDELLALADRICVLYRGRIAGERSRAAATRDALGRMMTGAGAV